MKDDCDPFTLISTWQLWSILSWYLRVIGHIDWSSGEWRVIGAQNNVFLDIFFSLSVHVQRHVKLIWNLGIRKDFENHIYLCRVNMIFQRKTDCFTKKYNPNRNQRWCLLTRFDANVMPETCILDILHYLVIKDESSSCHRILEKQLMITWKLSK